MTLSGSTSNESSSALAFGPVDDINPQCPLTYHATIIPKVIVYEVMQDLYHRQ